VAASPYCTNLFSTDFTLCSTCNGGYALNTATNLCVDCAGIGSCTGCVYNGSSGLAISCTTCSGGKIPQTNKQSCVTYASDCSVMKSSDY